MLRRRPENQQMPSADTPRFTPTGDAHARPYVRQERGHQSMHFSDAAIQSRMHTAQPDSLALEYTRTMMGFLIFDAAPQRIAMIGLGGGSMARFCHRHLPLAQLTVVEINPHVIALRERFKVPPESARFEVVQADGADFLAATAEHFDALLVDAFDADGIPEALVTRRFYDDCARALVPGGILVVNLHAMHPHFTAYVDRPRLRSWLMRMTPGAMGAFTLAVSAIAAVRNAARGLTVPFHLNPSE